MFGLLQFTVTVNLRTKYLAGGVTRKLIATLSLGLGLISLKVYCAFACVLNHHRETAKYQVIYMHTVAI